MAEGGHRGNSLPSTDTSGSTNNSAFCLESSYMLSSQFHPSFLLPFTLRFHREQEIFLRIFLFSLNQLNPPVDVPYRDLHMLT